jgi:hypothetical protein
MPRYYFISKRTAFTIVVLTLVAGKAGIVKLPDFKKTVTHIQSFSLYDGLNLSELGLKKEVFNKAYDGWKKLKDGSRLNRPELLSIVDMSQSSVNKRLYVIDIDNRKVLFNTYVSHGRNSGEEYARSFGNKLQCYKSSLGFYTTGSVYNGAHGLSMRLKGLENGINHCAEERGIVMHGAEYVSEDFIRRNGRLGRSQGCPAVSEKDCVPIINSIKEGSCFFIFYPDSDYFKRSSFYN